MHGDIGLGIDMAPDPLPPPSRAARTKSAVDKSTGSRQKRRSGTKAEVDTTATATTRRRKTVHEGLPICSQSNSQPLVRMRSSKAMDGLLFAEVGASMVEMDKLAGPKLKEGKPIQPGAVTPIPIPLAIPSLSKSRTEKARPRSRTFTSYDRRRGLSVDHGLSRQGTLLSSAPSSPIRRAEQLKVLLGDGSGKVKPGTVVVPDRLPKGASRSRSTGKKSKDSADAVTFEQGNSRARVALDLELENNVVVEGGYISGIITVRVRPKNKSDTFKVGGGKIRIAGFEVAPKNEDRFIFYQISAPLGDISNGCEGLYETGVDEDGLGTVAEGEYSVRFSLQIPLSSMGGKPRGILNNRSGSGTTIKYIIIGSMKVLDPNTGKRSISHFYRDCEIWPVLDPVATLAPASDPMLARAAKKLFMGGDGTIALTASLHRHTWVAGQPVHVRLRIVNGTKKSVKSVLFAVTRTTTIFKLAGEKGHVNVTGFEDEIDDGETCTNERRVAEVVLTTGQKGAKGRASAKGWWTGVGPGETGNVMDSITIPSDALTIPRARLVEVDYAVRVALGVSSIAGTSEAVHVTLPIRVVNFISLDPPPSVPMLPASTSAHSVIELDTPRQENYPETYPTSGTSGWEIVNSPPGLFTAAQNGYEIHPNICGYFDKRERANTLPRGAAPPAIPTAYTVHDLGSVEDADDLNGMLGDIPGSTSILEETDISMDSLDMVDSGYSEGGCSTRSSGFSHGHVRATQSVYLQGHSLSEDGPQVGWYRGHEEHSFEDGGEEDDVGSDEELEKMVGCASAQIDRGFFQQPEYQATSSTTSETGPHASDWSEQQQNQLVYAQPSSHRAGGTRVVRGPRSMGTTRRYEQQSMMTKSQPSLPTQSANIEGSVPLTQQSRRNDNVNSRISRSSHLVESPESMYPRSYTETISASMTSSKSKPMLLRASPSKSLVRPSHSRSNQASLSLASTVARSTDSGPLCGMTASATRHIVSRPSSNLRAGASGSVRSRIVALEQTSLEAERPANDCRMQQGYVSQSLATSAVLAYS